MGCDFNDTVRMQFFCFKTNGNVALDVDSWDHCMVRERGRVHGAPELIPTRSMTGLRENAGTTTTPQPSPVREAAAQLVPEIVRM